MSDTAVVFAFYREGEAKESAIMSQPVELEVLCKPPLAGSVLDVAVRFPGRSEGPVYVELPAGIEPWHALAALAADDMHKVHGAVHSARDYLCVEAPPEHEDYSRWVRALAVDAVSAEKDLPSAVQTNSFCAAVIAMCNHSVTAVAVLEESKGYYDVFGDYTLTKYDFYHSITWEPSDFSATLISHGAGHAKTFCAGDWTGGCMLFAEPLPCSISWGVTFRDRNGTRATPSRVVVSGSYVPNGKRPHARGTVCKFRLRDKIYYAAEYAILDKHPLEVEGWHGAERLRNVTVNELMYGFQEM